ncbi:Uncharacterised protein [Kluyvera intermedia]|nr:hypothetical protein [Kluyvera intermedia]VDZ86395.1 Uncharacterised protein [Kluyvera intermedia]
MNNICILKMVLMALFTFHFSSLFAKDEDKIIISKMPQDLQDFFETAEACEGWVSNFDPRLDKITYSIVEGCY